MNSYQLTMVSNRIRLIGWPYDFLMSSSYWHIREFDSETVDAVAKEFGLPPSIAKIMALRGITNRKISSEFFYPRKDNLYDPYLLKDMSEAVKKNKRTKRA